MSSVKKLLRTLVSFFLLVVVSVCAVAQSPVASFTVNVSTGCQPLSVQFNNTSQNAVSYLWTFGNGNTSNLANPSNIYNLSGNYTVTLIAYDAGGNSDTKTINNCITVVQSPQANFSANTLSACQGYGFIQFANTSTNFDSCLWDFGDGTTSNLLNPLHQYALAGVFNVSLLVFNSQHNCSDILTQSQYITIHPTPLVMVGVDTTVTCDSLHSFAFTASGSYMNSWNWLFGDGAFSSMQNPVHAYNHSGNFNVNLITTSSFGCADTASLNPGITIKNNPVPIITASDTAGCVPLGIQMHTNINNSQWIWSFGDGDSAFVQNPGHIYDSIGVFNIVLQVIQANGCNQTTRHDSIRTFDAPHPSFTITNQSGCAPLTVQFTNQTLGSFSWLWDFGDGTTSTLLNPTHTYDTTGYFIPSLTATSISGCSNISVNIWSYVSVLGPVANFYADITSGCPPLHVNFTDLSNNASHWMWLFGDGDTSTQQYPSHNYINGGSYTVTLIVTNSQGCKDTLIYPATINVATPVNNFIPVPPVTACAPFAAYFSDHSGAVSWLWNFGDGATSTLQNPNHVYTQPGTHIVSLTTQSASGGCSQYIANYSTFIIKGGVAYFTHTENICPPFIANFTDSSTNAVSWFWNFGDGTTSTSQNPSHTYGNNGYYDVTLTITTSDGCTATYIQNHGVHFTSFGAHPTAFTNDSVPPFSVQYFANSIGATSWLWSFGDGDTSTLQNPIHVYSSTGPFVLSLTIAGDSCNYTYDYPPVTFGGGNINPGGGGNGGGSPPVIVYNCAPYIVHFSNPVPGAMNWVWAFGDNTTSTLPDPMHIYQDTGTYQVILYTTDSAGNMDTLLYPQIFHIKKASSDFTINTTNTCNGVLVSLNTLSPASSYNWSFGDGTTSSLSNPFHQYSNASSNYVVSLNVTDTNGCTAFITQSFYTGTSNPLSSNVRRTCAGDSVYFYCGTVNYSSYLWNFGDGDTSHIKNSFHVYPDSGLFTVSLTVTDINGCVINYVLPNPILVYNPLANFSFTPAVSNCVSVASQMTNLSTGAANYLWNFGDGTTSVQVSPLHYFSGFGYHDITLIANKNICSSSKIIPSAVYVPNRSINFSYVQNGGCLPVTANFIDQSVDAVKWHWDFGDGDTSNLQNPIHVFTHAPSGNITLSITDVNGCTVSLSQPKLPMSGAAFSVSATSGCNPSSVLFADSSLNAVSWFWNFGDGDTSTLQNPVHVYSNNGIYNVQLIIQGNSGCTDTLQFDSLLTVSSSTAGFIANNTIGCVPLVVDFTDQSVNATSWFWDFGDGSTSSNQNSSHIFNQPGIFTVTLIVTNVFGCADTLVMNNYVTVRGSVPAFTLSDSLGCNPLLVSFTDHSQGAISWSWNFGDGSTDSTASPIHIYTLDGTFIVTLITHDFTGCVSSFSYPNPIQVSAMPEAIFTTEDTTGCAPLSVSFNNQSINADSVVWYFGDGNISTDFNPFYTYTTTGSYTPILIAFNIGGCVDTFILSQPIIVNPQPHVDFTSDVVQGCASLPVNFTNLSYNLSNPIFLWDFGNGDTSSLLNPSATYNIPGFNDVTLTVINEGGCSDVMLKNAYIRVYDSAPPPVSQIKSVSVSSNSEVEIQWDLCPSVDFSYYTLYRFNPASGVFDSVANFNQSNASMNQGYPVYTDGTLNTLGNTYSYRIQTTDLCGNHLDTSLSRTHTTINLQAIAVGKNVELNWSPYEGCALAAYEIYRDDNETGSYSFIESVTSSQLSFTDSTTYCPFNYSYKIKATDLCGDLHFVSWSDSAMAQPQSNISLQKVEIVRSTVVDDNYVLTEWKPPVIAPSMVMGYKILRSGDQVNYNEITTVTAAELSYSDHDVDVHNYQYFYKITVVNQCNIETTPAENSSSVLLRASDTEFISHLRWTKYLEWDTGVQKYVIEKQDAQGIWHEIKTVDGNTTEMEDH